jgi:hypothetical protein
MAAPTRPAALTLPAIMVESVPTADKSNFLSLGFYACRTNVQRAFLIAVGVACGLVATALILSGGPLLQAD